MDWEWLKDAALAHWCREAEQAAGNLVGFDPGTTAEDVRADPFGHGNNLIGQVILTPQGGALFHVSGKDVSLVVLEFGEGPVTGQCQLVGAPVIATGTGKATSVSLAPRPGAALVAHVTVQGVVDLVSGGQARVLGTARVTVLPDGTLLFDEERVTLNPDTPKSSGPCLLRPVAANGDRLNSSFTGTGVTNLADFTAVFARGPHSVLRNSTISARSRAVSDSPKRST